MEFSSKIRKLFISYGEINSSLVDSVNQTLKDEKIPVVISLKTK